MNHSQTDEQLLERIREGDRDALAALYMRYRKRLYVFCLRMLKTEAKAEDAVHDTFLKICNCAHAVENSESFQSWVFRIARNEALMAIRKKREQTDGASDDAWDDETPLSLLTKKNTSEILREMIDDLKAEYREVLLLREYEQFSYEQIAGITSSTESSVKSRLHKARLALAKRAAPFFRERREV
ncbi:MAG: sigma-70 family RNA polymerase sigma factor [Ignavibacteriae bacterium]|nr:sigma-70 family RNA polymerase sigma factor [Ignavibacteriota bacterium]